MAKFDWEKAWDDECKRLDPPSAKIYRWAEATTPEQCRLYNQIVQTVAKKYAAHVLREKAEAYMASGNVAYGFLGRDIATRFRREADELDPQPEVIKLEKGKTYQLPDGSKVTT